MKKRTRKPSLAALSREVAVLRREIEALRLQLQWPPATFSPPLIHPRPSPLTDPMPYRVDWQSMMVGDGVPCRVRN